MSLQDFTPPEVSPKAWPARLVDCASESPNDWNVLRCKIVRLQHTTRHVTHAFIQSQILPFHVLIDISCNLDLAVIELLLSERT